MVIEYVIAFLITSSLIVYLAVPKLYIISISTTSDNKKYLLNPNS